MDSLPQVPLTMERALYIGNCFAAILYGGQLTLCIQSIHYLLKDNTPARRRIFYMCFSIAMALMKAIGLMANTLYGQYVWIEGRNTPGGPGTYFILNSGWWVNTLGSFSAVVAVGLNDGLMLHRLYLILNQSILAIIVPGILFLGAIAIGLASCIFSALPNGFIFAGLSSKLATAWIAVSITFNILSTLMISTRLLQAHRKMEELFSKEHANTYTGVVAILIESALPLAVFGIIAAIFYGLDHPAAFAVTMLWSFFTGISPQLIILRVSMGKAWSQETMSRQISTLRFHEPSGQGTQMRTTKTGSTMTGTDVTDDHDQVASLRFPSSS